MRKHQRVLVNKKNKVTEVVLENSNVEVVYIKPKKHVHGKALLCMWAAGNRGRTVLNGQQIASLKRVLNAV